MITEIHVWFGVGEKEPYGPLAGLLIEFNSNGRSKIEIVDQGWLQDLGFDEDCPYYVECKHIGPDNFVRYDSYAWSYPGECNIKTKFC